jgi:hypothetical protein
MKKIKIKIIIKKVFFLFITLIIIQGIIISKKSTIKVKESTDPIDSRELKKILKTMNKNKKKEVVYLCSEFFARENVEEKYSIISFYRDRNLKILMVIINALPNVFLPFFIKKITNEKLHNILFYVFFVEKIDNEKLIEFHYLLMLVNFFLTMITRSFDKVFKGNFLNKDKNIYVVKVCSGIPVIDFICLFLLYYNSFLFGQLFVKYIKILKASKHPIKMKNSSSPIESKLLFNNTKKIYFLFISFLIILPLCIEDIIRWKKINNFNNYLNAPKNMTINKLILSPKNFHKIHKNVVVFFDDKIYKKNL